MSEGKQFAPEELETIIALTEQATRFLNDWEQFNTHSREILLANVQGQIELYSDFIQDVLHSQNISSSKVELYKDRYITLCKKEQQLKQAKPSQVNYYTQRAPFFIDALQKYANTSYNIQKIRKDVICMYENIICEKYKSSN